MKMSALFSHLMSLRLSYRRATATVTVVISVMILALGGSTCTQAPENNNVTKLDNSSLIIDEFRNKFENQQYLCLISYSSECPIAKTYIQTIKELHKQYGDSIRFCLLDPGVGSKSITGMEDCYFNDASLVICTRYNIRVYPQAVLVNCLTRKILYSGKIDDRAVDVGVVKTVAQHHFLTYALSQLCSKGVVTVKSNEPVGCFVGDFGLKQHD
jgi:hypothetical protein